MQLQKYNTLLLQGEIILYLNFGAVNYGFL